jgi:thymidylate synthase
MTCNEFNSFDEALFHGLSTIINKGESSFPRGEHTKEILGHSFKLLNPRARLINIKARKWNFAYALGELCWHLNGSNKLDEISYYSKSWNNFSEDKKTIIASCYGAKIFTSKNNETNQWDNLVHLLKKDIDTRRAILVLSKDEDLFGNDVPCVTSIQFIVRKNKLNCITNMRSNDIIWGMCYDVFFVTFLQEMLAVQMKLELGWYIHNTGSFHLYDRHIDMAKKILNEGIPREIPIMDPITDLKYLNEYLEIEKLIRTGEIVSEERIDSLPAYWRKLAIPFKENHRKKSPE